MKLLFSICFLIVVYQSSNSSRWEPQVLNGIKWTSENQSQQLITFATQQKILRIPVKYYGGVDMNTDGIISEEDIEKFSVWVEDNIPNSYTGPIVMDYEKPWWEELRGETITSERLKVLMTPYIEGLNIARSLRPNAKWGYYGIPTRRNTSKQWLAQGHSLEPIFSRSGALFPAIYDCSRGKDRTKEVQRQIEQSLQAARGRIPVYAFMTPRYCGENGNRSLFVPDDVFLRQANAALKAKWIDEQGVEHRIKGIIMWDAFGYTPEEGWAELDAQHIHYMTLLLAITDAWGESMKNLPIVVAPEQYQLCQQGLPHLENSGLMIGESTDQNVINNKLTGERVENEKVPDNRVPN